jgi:hypothetical protein
VIGVVTSAERHFCVARYFVGSAEERPPGLMPTVIFTEVTRPEGPFFHGDAYIGGFSAACKAALKTVWLQQR